MHKNHGVNTVLYGDIFLDDVKRYRDEMLSKIDMNNVYPLRKKNSQDLAHKFIELNLKAVIAVVDSKVIGEEYSGREYAKHFLADLPGVDPCSENGEFHTFVNDSPIFSKPLTFTEGEVMLRENRF